MGITVIASQLEPTNPSFFTLRPEIQSVRDPQLQQLTQQLSDLSAISTTQNEWPGRQLRLCEEAGVFKWFLSEDHGGTGWSDQEIVEGYVKLAAACLTTTFVITQRTGACKRIAESENHDLAGLLLPGLANGSLFATLGISHLTTSSRHFDKPILEAHRNHDGWQLTGVSPWVTGAEAADYLVIASEVGSEGQILFAIPANLPGVEPETPNSLVALSGSRTGRVRFDAVQIADNFVLSGPRENVLKRGQNQSTGGLQTSALAIGLASSAVEFVKRESVQKSRSDLQPTADALDQQLQELSNSLFQLAAGNPVCSNEQLRIDANSFVLRATQSALVAAKGAGFVEGHAVGRWCREALFFLVWSCPQPVRNANLCELAGITD